MTGQLPLDLPHSPSFTDEDFLEAPFNEKALAMIRLWPDWPQKALLLLGPRGSGKSHLGAIWARRAGAEIFSACDLRLEILPDWRRAGPAAGRCRFRAIARGGNVPSAQSRGREGRFSLLMTAEKHPDHWGLATPDLLSRLRRAPAVAIAAPDEAFLRAILVKFFYDRQIRVDETVVDFLALRLERSFEAAQKIVAALDREGLARGVRSRAAGRSVLKAQRRRGLKSCGAEGFFCLDG